jgi:hypothetical protein
MILVLLSVTFVTGCGFVAWKLFFLVRGFPRLEGFTLYNRILFVYCILQTSICIICIVSVPQHNKESTHRTLWYTYRINNVLNFNVFKSYMCEVQKNIFFFLLYNFYGIFPTHEALGKTKIIFQFIQPRSFQKWYQLVQFSKSSTPRSCLRTTHNDGCRLKWSPE